MNDKQILQLGRYTLVMPQGPESNYWYVYFNGQKRWLYQDDGDDYVLEYGDGCRFTGWSVQVVGKLAKFARNYKRLTR